MMFMMKYLSLAFVIVTALLTSSCVAERNGLAAKEPFGTSCVSGTEKFIPPITTDTDASDNRTILRANISLSDETTLEIHELQSPTGDDDYNTTVTIAHDTVKHKYVVSKLIKQGQALRLMQATTVCSASGRKVVILGFEAGSTDATQGFVVVSASAPSHVWALPIVRQGKLVVSSDNPQRAVLWSTTPADQLDCDACKKRYIVQDCTLGEDVNCHKRKRLIGPLDPNEITREIVETR